MKTFSLKREQIKKDWILIDANNAVLGRLAVISANILRGKNKPQYTPNQDCGDNLIIINSDKVYMTGKKENNKIYYRHTGYPGGIKETTPSKMKEKNKSSEIIKQAIKRMIPKGPLGRKQLSNCKIFSGSEHNHQSQNPKLVDISTLNNKNVLR
ncbi:MAG: 50S ribosomal protein L13 [Alphaproteobacteria bacterium MarineAlpha5_Bin8]|nr:MAG: 50S ribosomal protein L13 [Alphaproteobacteria bacterium MarineAlpha5_Bin8]PPR45895.1 MAG: 50S ribosomal protein L13 [Alphaproteobacteria bacterium MarineAlpha5_Bin7]PPR53159.1 MAG: 50S ribosomal protein L13 [Alphaproteobacteria bacterium MarineAlpha5_Bin6]|tara:strand:- start:1064 stop:1525 length:462 start_codon:yes stop_codon:yes gene_type:complete